MRVLMLADGRSVHTVRFQGELKAQGCTVGLASVEPGDTVDYRFKRRSGISGLDYTLASRELSTFISDFKPDILNPHYASGYGYIAALGNSKNIPAVMHCLGSDILIDPYKSFLQKARSNFVLRKIPRVLVDSEFLGEKARAISSKADSKVVYWGADDAAFDIFRDRKLESRNSAEPLRILVPRPHKKVYNNQFIIESLSDIIREDRVEISFPSWGEELDEFQRLADRRCPSGRVLYYPYMTRDEYNRFLGRFDIYLSASKSDSSPASLIEAMASGLYPIAADIPGVREWLDNNNGTLFDLDKQSSLHDAITNALEKRESVKNILIRNHEKAKIKGRFKDNIRDTLEIFRKVIEDDRW